MRIKFATVNKQHSLCRHNPLYYLKTAEQKQLAKSI